MVNKQKQKGTGWERDLVKMLQERVGGHWKRLPTSGAIGTALGESKLTGDVVGRVDFLPKSIKIEAKVGYGGATQLTMKKEWLDKIRMEAEADNAIPALAGKFSGARDGTKYFIAFDFDTFVYLMKLLEEQQKELDKLYENAS